MLLAGDGHEVTVWERDPAEVPEGDADVLWCDWQRPGVSQFRLPNTLPPGWLALMERELPAVVGELVSIGGVRTNLIDTLPVAMTGGRRAGDERFDKIAARRPAVEAALARAASCTPGVQVRRGVAVTGLDAVSDAVGGVPRITGLIAGGETVPADLVIDAGGRRSPVKGFLKRFGIEYAQEREDAGFVYYARHFRSSDGSYPAALAMDLQHFESISVLATLCERGTWLVGLITSATDRQLRALREPEVWNRVLALFPTLAHWAEAEAITGVQVMAGLEDRYSRLVVDGSPVVTGFAAIGDAWATTNPSLGRGATIGALHACALRDVLREVGVEAADKLVRRFDEVTEEKLGPLYRRTLSFDRHRLAEIDGDVAGQPYRTSSRSWAIGKALGAAALRDPDALRAFLSAASLVDSPPGERSGPAPGDLMAGPDAQAPRYPSPGPSRSQLLAAIG
ncbi:hypothetical protein ACFYWY_08415 [Streptomyces sp. NPDC002870]|uniref:hypothetical protein n=1 Tax=Streptomyces sp. NPDC002870 TaxID=3364666 RepID=UPI0036B9D202